MRIRPQRTAQAADDRTQPHPHAGAQAPGLARRQRLHVFELHEEITGPVPLLPMFRRGRIDHFGLNAPDEHALRTVRDRLLTDPEGNEFCLLKGRCD